MYTGLWIMIFISGAKSAFCRSCIVSELVNYNPHTSFLSMVLYQTNSNTQTNTAKHHLELTWSHYDSRTRALARSLSVCVNSNTPPHTHTHTHTHTVQPSHPSVLSEDILQFITAGPDIQGHGSE